MQWLWRRRPLRWEFTPHSQTLRNTGCLHCTPVISKPRDRRRCQAEGRLKSINRYPTRKLVQVKPSRWTRCRNQQEPRRASGTDVGPPTPSHPDSRCLYLVNDPTVLKHSRVFAHKRAVCPLVLSTRLQPISRTALELSLFPCPASSLSAPRESECSVLSGIRNKLQLTRLFSVQNTKAKTRQGLITGFSIRKRRRQRPGKIDLGGNDLSHRPGFPMILVGSSHFSRTTLYETYTRC